MDSRDVCSQIWTGMLKDGSWIVGFFNREDTTQTRQLHFATLGLKDKWKVRDMWRHANKRPAAIYRVTLVPHACKVIHLTK